MLITRILFVLCLTLILIYLPLPTRYFIWLKPVNKSPWETLKWLVIPLTCQTIFEFFLPQPSIYLPSRFIMLIVGMILMGMLSTILKLAHVSNSIIVSICYFISLLTAYFAEYIYRAKDILLHPYDTSFAGLGILFIVLIFILNTYSPSHHWFFKE